MIYVNIAVLMTCHNRRDTTLACLDALFKQELSDAVTFKVYLVDDGSTDGTGEIVSQQYPGVRVIKGSGNLYWCGGMRMAWTEAMKKDYDYYLWLNDDTTLLPNVLFTFISSTNTLKKINDNSIGIIVGSTCHPETGVHTYGGYIQAKKKSLDFKPVIPSATIQACDAFNGNCVLVSREAFRQLGNISPEFTHVIGDIDYGLRAKEKNISMWVAPKYIGKCSSNPSPSWLDNNLPFHQRITNLHDLKGLPPNEWMIFCRRHTGWWWPFKVLNLYLRVLYPEAWERIKKIIK